MDFFDYLREIGAKISETIFFGFFRIRSSPYRLLNVLLIMADVVKSRTDVVLLGLQKKTDQARFRIAVRCNQCN